MELQVGLATQAIAVHLALAVILAIVAILVFQAIQEFLDILDLVFLAIADILAIQAHKAHPLLLKVLLPPLLIFPQQEIKLMMLT